MVFHIALTLSLLALVAGMYLLAKTRTENLGRLFSFVSWLVISVSAIALAGQLVCAAWMLSCHLHGERTGCGIHSGFHHDGECGESKHSCGSMSHCCDMRDHEERDQCCHGGEGNIRCVEGEGKGQGMGKGCGMEMERDSSGKK